MNHNYYYKTCYAHPYHKLLLSKGYPPSIYLSSATVAAKSLQSCPTLCDPIDGSPPGSAIPGILQAKILEWGAIAFSDIYHLSICKYDMELTQRRKVKIGFQIQTIKVSQPPAVMNYFFLTVRSSSAFENRCLGISCTVFFLVCMWRT